MSDRFQNDLWHIEAKKLFYPLHDNLLCLLVGDSSLSRPLVGGVQVSVRVRPGIYVYCKTLPSLLLRRKITKIFQFCNVEMANFDVLCLSILLSALYVVFCWLRIELYPEFFVNWFLSNTFKLINCLIVY